MGAIVHHHPRGAGFVVDLYGWRGLEFHLKVAHDVDTSVLRISQLAEEHDNHHAHEGSTVAPVVLDDDVVEESLADAMGPVPFGEWRLRTGSCEHCQHLATLPATDAVMWLIKCHAVEDHAESLIDNPLV